MVSQETLTYTCINDDDDLTWSSSVFHNNYALIVSPFSIPPSMQSSTDVSGVTFTESNNNDNSCLNSTLTFSGDLKSLTALNGIILNCTDYGETPSSVTFMIPSK